MIWGPVEQKLQRKSEARVFLRHYFCLLREELGIFIPGTTLKSWTKIYLHWRNWFDQANQSKLAILTFWKSIQSKISHQTVTYWICFQRIFLRMRVNLFTFQWSTGISAEWLWMNIITFRRSSNRFKSNPNGANFIKMTVISFLLKRQLTNACLAVWKTTEIEIHYKCLIELVSNGFF